MENKYIKNFREACKKLEEKNNIILDEAKRVGTLYHATTIAALEDILKSDKLISSAFSGTGTSQGISITRDKTFFITVLYQLY